MSQFVAREALRQASEIVSAPVASATERMAVRDTIDRTFELPTGLYAATVALYLGFVAVMTLAFKTPGLLLPLAVIAFSVAAIFGVPAIWSRMQPAKSRGAMSYGTFRNTGIMTASGHMPAGSAMAQVLVLPILIFTWGVAIAVIAALT